MSTLQKSPTILTAVGARRKTDRLVTTLTEAHELLIELWEGHAWEALDYPNWQTYCAGELGDLLTVRLPVAQRREAVAAMRAAGMSVRNIAAPLGVSVGTIAADIHPPKPKTVPQPDRPKTDVIVELVTAQGDRGMTCLEVEHETGWRHGVASGPFSRLARGRLRHTGRYRLGYGVYVVA